MNVKRRRWWGYPALFAMASGGWGAVSTGCSSTAEDGSGSSTAQACLANRDYFLTQVWGPVFEGKGCVGCHTDGGQAILKGAKLQLHTSSYPGFVDANMENVSTEAQLLQNFQGNPVSLLLLKPTGRVTHGGGAVITTDSPEYQALSGFVDRINKGDPCPNAESTESVPNDVQLLNAPMTVRKAALDLLGRMPTSDELQKAQGGDAALDEILGAMLEEPAFYGRLTEITNDLLLTDTYLNDGKDGCNARAIDMLPADELPSLGGYQGGNLDCCNGSDMNKANYDSQACVSLRATRGLANNAVAREAVNLYTYVVKNNRPFSEIVTAPYVLVNSASAQLYGVSGQVKFTNASDPTEVHEAKVTVHYSPDQGKTVPYKNTAYPHAGVLSTPAFLTRYPTTETNRNRHRARFVQKLFLSADILKFGTRPLDANAAAAIVQNPVMNNGPCVTCHKINDPIAGTFGAFDHNNQALYKPDATWYNDMFPPGYEADSLVQANFATGLAWLGGEVAKDPRFALASVYFAYTGLTGHQPLTFPTDTTDPLFKAKAAAWEAQDTIFQGIVKKFQANNLNFKTAVIELIKSPYYRGIAGPTTINDAGKAQLADLGVGRLLTPELLDRKVSAIMGLSWQQDPTKASSHWLTSEFYLPYGGIDSFNVTTRATDSNGIVDNISLRLANEMACRATSYDFALPKEQRRLFPGVEVNVVPAAAGNPVPANVDSIKQTIVGLHELILGEQLTVDDPEVARTYQLFLDTFNELSTAAKPDLLCGATVDLRTGKPLPMAQQVTSDPNFTVRSWQAVVAYLLADFKFIYE